MFEKNINDFKQFIKDNKKNTSIRLYFDIETLTYNKIKGKEKPTFFKNVTYSVAISYYNNNDLLKVVLFPNFKEFFNAIFEACTTRKKISCKARIELIAHNNNKYDNHFLLHDLLFYYPFMERKNLFLKNADDNINALSVKELTKEMKQGIILEKRIKTRNNMELEFFINGIHFKTIDNFMKTNLSIKTLGEKLLKINRIKEKELKTSFEYDAFDIDTDMNENEAHMYAKKCWQKLTKEQFTYIKNDVIILAKAVKYYSELFIGFDWEKITFTSNILESYKTNDLTSFQLLNEVGTFRDKQKIKYTDYKFCGINFYDWLKPFYNGGLNMYNDSYVGTIVKNLFSIDINSSFPFVMHNEKIPTYLESYQEFEEETEIKVIDNENKFYLYKMEKETFNNEILLTIDSKIFAKMLVKYYNEKEFVSINSNTIRTIEKITKRKIDYLTVKSYVCYDCVYFGNREEIEKNYFTKTQGKLDNVIIMNSPYDYKILDEKNTNHFSQEEIDNSKVKLNGLYGIPALRATFHLYRLLENYQIESIPNGYHNSERNIVFSIFVTSKAFYNLLLPLSYLTQNEIDENFIYCDTDSLYLKKDIQEKIPSHFFDKIKLGSWDIENNHISKMLVLNHKKYCYYSNDLKNGKEKGLVVKCGGVPLNSFDTTVSFEEFVETQFYHGAKIKNTKSIYTLQENIAIYESITEIEKGKNYPLFYTSKIANGIDSIMNHVKDELLENGINDFMYIESEIGSFSMTDVFPIKNSIEGKNSLNVLQFFYQKIREKIEENE